MSAGISGIVFAAHTQTTIIMPISNTTGDAVNFNITVTNNGADNITSIVVNYTNFVAGTAPTNVVCGNGFARDSVEAANTINCTNTSAANDIDSGSAINVTFTKTAPVAPNTTVGQYFFTVTTVDNSSASASTQVDVRITDNDAPSVYLSSPANSTTSAANVSFQYTVTDNSNTYGSCYVYGNFSGAWARNQTNQTAVGSGTNNISVTLTDGVYIWNVNCSDTSGNSAFNATNTTLTVDAIPPGITASGPTGTQTSGTVTLTATTNESATCKYDTTYMTNYTNMSSTFTSTGSTSHTNTLTLANGNYVYYVLCRDVVNNTMTTVTTISFTVSVVTTPAGGGGGGAAAPSEPSETQGISGIQAGTSATVTMANPNLIMTSLEISAAELILNGQITVMQSSGQPASIAVEAGGKVYKYIIIDKSGIADTAIQSAKIRFRVLKSWMADNGYGTADIVLSRYSNGAWTDLTTRLTNQGTAEYFFEADSPGLSVYAIKAVKAAAAAPSPGTTPGAAGENATTPSGGELPEEQPLPDYTVTIIALIVLAVAAAGIWYYLKNEKEFKHLPWRRNVGFRPHKAGGGKGFEGFKPHRK